MMLGITTGTGVANSDIGYTTAYWSIVCFAHAMTVESLRGSNRTRRVETVRCTFCGHRERRIWTGDWTQRKPDKVISLASHTGGGSQ